MAGAEAAATALAAAGVTFCAGAGEDLSSSLAFSCLRCHNMQNQEKIVHATRQPCIRLQGVSSQSKGNWSFRGMRGALCSEMKSSGPGAPAKPAHAPHHLARYEAAGVERLHRRLLSGAI